jgi:hypothetical protein
MMQFVFRFRRPALTLGAALLLLSWSEAGAADDPVPARERPFRIEVVDDETGRGVPLVELRTTNEIRFFTDSQGIVAFDEPGLLGRKVFFNVSSHGYEFPKDGFGIRGVALETKPGGSARIKIHRLNIAKRLYRMTGQGIYRDSVLTGMPVPTKEPLLNAQVMGQDSVLNTIYQGRIYWFWGDTGKPSYPLGNFHTPGATSELPGKGGLDPATGVNLSYFVGKDGFARPACEMPGPGPTWISGLVVLRGDDGRERMFANYVKIRPPMEAYQRGLAEFDPQANQFRKLAEFPMDTATYPGEQPGGHTFLKKEGDVEYIYYAMPFPLLRIPARPEALLDPDTREAFTCLAPGTRLEDGKVDRRPDGTLNYSWKKRTGLVSQQQQGELIRKGKLRADEALLNLRDIETGKEVLAHGGSVYWNPYRRRWVMIAVQTFGTSLLGEVWFAEADTPLGPWVYARKIVTHNDYSFYNPKQHPFFDQQDGRVIYFEGTYTFTFSGNKDHTPRYDYNQVMYQLDLADPRLALPVPIYAVDREGTTRLVPGPAREESETVGDVAFFAPDRPGLATIPVRQGQAADAPPLFYVLKDTEKPPAGTVPLHVFREKEGNGRYHSIEETPRPGFERSGEPLGRVWKKPAGLEALRPGPNPSS